MPVRLAKQLCPEAIVIRGDMEAYSYHSSLVTEIIAQKAPLCEKASIDEHYIDLTGMDRFFGSVKWAGELRQQIIRETGLPLSMGVSPNKTVSKIATGEAKPNGEKQVPEQDVKPFLFPLPVRRIPGIGEKTYQLLRNMGICRIETLSQMPVQMVERVLGKAGRNIWEKANGIDLSPVVPYSEQKSMGREITFEDDTTDLSLLQGVLLSMTEGLAYELRKQKKVTACLTVKIRYSNFDTHTQQAKLPFTAADHTLIGKAKELLAKLYQRRMLIRLIGVRFSHLVSGYQQIHLFEESAQLAGLYQAMDHVRDLYGTHAVGRAAGMGLSHRSRNTSLLNSS
jgi:DNA polymerase-4